MPSHWQEARTPVIFCEIGRIKFGDHCVHRIGQFLSLLLARPKQRELNLERGSNFGLAQNMFQIGPFRPKVWDDQVQNLFYCGASVQPGTYFLQYVIRWQTATTTVGITLGVNFTGTAASPVLNLRHVTTGTTAADAPAAGTGMPDSAAWSA